MCLGLCVCVCFTSHWIAAVVSECLALCLFVFSSHQHACCHDVVVYYLTGIRRDDVSCSMQYLLLCKHIIVACSPDLIPSQSQVVKTTGTTQTLFNKPPGSRSVLRISNEILVAPKLQHFKTPPALIMASSFKNVLSLAKMAITHHKEKWGEALEVQQCLWSSAGASF